MSWLPDERYAAEFDAETTRLSAVALTLAPDSRVPTCPEWTVRDLVTHVGTGHRWSATMIETRAPGPIVPIPQVPAPDAPAEWAGWLAEGARRLIDAVREIGATTEVWTWQADRTAGFWLRRMTHDELIHRYDVEHAAGITSEAAEDVAADGISDFLDTAATLSRPTAPDSEFKKLRGDGETLRFETPSGTWLVRRTPDGVTWSRTTATTGSAAEASVAGTTATTAGTTASAASTTASAASTTASAASTTEAAGAAEATAAGAAGAADAADAVDETGAADADVVVRGASWPLLLVLNRRLEPASVTVTGDTALFTHWWECGKF